MATTTEIEKMIEAGVFDGPERVFLRDGRLYEKSTLPRTGPDAANVAQTLRGRRWGWPGTAVRRAGSRTPRSSDESLTRP